MKIIHKLGIFLLVFAVLAVLAGCKSEAPVFQVADVAADPGAYSGTLTVVGVAYGYSQADPAVVGIMDKKELQCVSPTCNKQLLPVKVNGARPAIGDEVKITGTFSREPWGYLFHAEAVEVVANHKLGG